MTPADEWARERAIGTAIQEELKIALKVITVLTSRLGGKVAIDDADIANAPSMKAWRDESLNSVIITVGDEADSLIDKETAQE